MKPLSEQLNELANRVKKSEDFVNAARAKDRAFLQNEPETLKTSIDNGKAQMKADAAADADETRSWWNDTRRSIDARSAELRARRDDHRAERTLKRAERRAEDAEQDAAYAVDFALSTLDDAEYAVADAVLARLDADELAAGELTSSQS
jgi:hypothetical protein